MRAAGTALAIERYRQDRNGDLPATLDELMPQYIDSVPTDPFDGKPLRYRQATVRGYSVYSIGENRIDDGGDPRNARADVIFTVHK